MRKTCWVLAAAFVLGFPLGCGHPTTMIALTVTPSVAGVVGVGVSSQIQFKAIGQFVNPSEFVDVTNQVAWASLATQVVTVNQQGVATSGTSCGVATITATAGEPLIGNVGAGAIVTATASFTVANPSNPSCPQTVPTGGGSGPPPPTPANFQGQWQLIAISHVTNSGGANLIEANWTQSGSQILAGPATVIPLRAGYVPNGWTVNACQGGNGLDGTNPNNNTFSATVTGNNVNFTLTETGPNGTYVITGATVVSSGGLSLSGTYSTAGGCGLAADSGTITGDLIPGNTTGLYSGALDGVSYGVIDVTQGAGSDPYTITLSVSGTNTLLVGQMVGGAFSVLGTWGNFQNFFINGIYLTPSVIDLNPAQYQNVWSQSGLTGSPVPGSFLLWDQSGNLGMLGL